MTCGSRGSAAEWGERIPFRDEALLGHGPKQRLGQIGSLGPFFPFSFSFSVFSFLFYLLQFRFKSNKVLQYSNNPSIILNQ
jgi:hypothetical protein